MNGMIQMIISEMDALSPSVETVKRRAGHGECNGWGLGGEPYGARCGCGLPFNELMTLARDETVAPPDEHGESPTC